MTPSARLPKRRYFSPRRQAAVARTRAVIVSAATTVLQRAGWSALTLNAVARQAGVTRVTVYNHFGGRGALLEAVFDAHAEQGGMHELHHAMALSDPHVALARVVAVFCGFWYSRDTLLGEIMAEAMRDPEFAAAIAARNDRRRGLLDRLVGRMVDRGEVERGRADRLVGTLFALTGYAFFRDLRGAGLSDTAIVETIGDLATAAVRDHGPPPKGRAI